MISSYYFRGSSQEPWEFDETRLSNINLFVGATGSGKTRFLNTLFNLAGFVSKGEPFRAGQWRITAETNGREYKWEFHCDKNKQGKNEIIHETLGRKLIGSDAAFEVLIQRTPEQFSFRGNTLPKLQVDKPSVTLLKEEEVIRPFHETFEKIQRRKFQDEELRNAMALQPVTKEQIDSIKSGGILALWEQGHALSAKMFLLKEHFSDLYQVSVDAFKQVFGTLIECDVQWSDKIRLSVSVPPLPVFVVKEKGVKGWVPLHELSSGMQKVLLIISDIISLPKGSIYLIDEYENSLGVNAIDFLPQFLLDHGESLQFLITTHHPYLINSMPIKSWRVFHRTGSKVAIKEGAELEQKYGKSKQQSFIQLMNDPFYAGTE